MKVLLIMGLLILSDLTLAQNTQKNRARLLDYMLDNYSELQHPNVRDFLKHCPQMQHTTGANQSYCTSVYNGKKNLLNRLSELLGKVRNETISHERAIEVASCLPLTPPSFNDLEQILQRLDSREDCAPLNSGDFKVSKFLLQRKADGNYDAVVNVDFKYVSGNVTAAAMKGRINQCLSGFTPYFRSPSGETLSVRVMAPDEINAAYPIGMRPPVTEVQIHQGKTTDANGNETQYRANAANYPDNIPCNTIVHETLHHLGLCDEYHETSSTILPNSTKTYKDAFSCRVVPDRNTVMARQDLAIAAVVPQKFSCRCRSDACRNTLKASDEEARNLRELLTKGDSYSTIPQAVMRHCRTDYLNPGLYPMTEPTKKARIISSNEYSIKLDHRYLSSMPSVGGNPPRYVVQRRLVDCNCNGDRDCIAAIPQALERINSNLSANSCPLEMDSIENSHAVASSGDSTRIDGDVIHFVTTPLSRESLLSPNHFNRILFGDCSSGPAGNYNRCASYAYTSTTDPDCASRPAACSDDGFFLDGAPQ